jgi:multidrug resistance efflux pump
MNKKALLTAVALLAASAAGLGCWYYLNQPPQGLSLPGVVEIQEVRLASKVGGRVAKVAVAEGDLVSPGQPLVYFEVPELLAQRDQQRARYEQAVKDYEKAVNGARPQEKDAAKAAAAAALAKYERLKAGYRPEEVQSALEDWQSAEAELQKAQKDLVRAEDVYRKKAGTREEFDRALGTRDRNRAQAQSAKARYDMLKSGYRAEEVAEALQQWKQAQANSDLLEAGTREEDIYMAKARMEEAKAKLDELEVNLKEQVVYAKERAVVEVLAVRQGDVVAPNTPVVRVLRAEDLWVKVFVPETELGKVRLHQQVQVTMDSYPGRHFQGEVIQVASASEFTPRNVQSPDERRHQVFAVKVRVADPQGVFKSGMAAQVWLPLAE